MIWLVITYYIKGMHYKSEKVIQSTTEISINIFIEEYINKT